VAGGVDAVWTACGLPLTRCTSVDAAELAGLLDRGRLPVLAGALGEADGGVLIVSSDRVTETVATALGAARVVWATDVDGVLSAPGEAGELVAALDPLDAGRSAALVDPAEPSTGSMRGKVESALRLAAAGIPSQIVNGRVPGRVAAALAGRPVLGTRVGSAEP
jgi:isopentenyl phosphate kinase